MAKQNEIMNTQDNDQKTPESPSNDRNTPQNTDSKQNNSAQKNDLEIEEFGRSFDYIDYLVYTKYLSLHTSFDKAEAIKRIALTIDKMSDVIRRRVYLNDLAETVQVPVEVLLEYIDKVNELPF